MNKIKNEYIVNQYIATIERYEHALGLIRNAKYERGDLVSYQGNSYYVYSVSVSSSNRLIYAITKPTSNGQMPKRSIKLMPNIDEVELKSYGTLR